MRPVIVLGALIVLAVAVSRVRPGVHWHGDVVGGALLRPLLRPLLLVVVYRQAWRP